MNQKHQLVILPNGLQVVLYNRPGVYSVAFSCYIKAGSSFETIKTSGATHFAEHLLFRGTKSHPAAELIRKRQENLGAWFAAFTTYNKVKLYGKFPAEEVENSLNLVKEILFESLYKRTDVEKERGVIEEEQRIGEDIIAKDLNKLLLKTRYEGKNHPLSLPVIGEPETIKKLTREILFRFYKKHFQPQNMIFALAGKIDYHKTPKLIERIFGQIKNQSPQPIYPFKKFKYSSLKIETLKRDSANIYLYLTFPFPSFSLSLDERLAFNLGNRIFLSRIGENLYEKRGLVYQYGGTWVAQTEKTGYYYLYLTCAPQKIPEIPSLVLRELKMIKATGPKQKELTQIRNYLTKTWPQAFDNLEGAADWLLDDLAWEKKIMFPAYWVKRLNKVSLKGVKKVFGQAINFSKLNIVAAGPIERQSMEKAVQGVLKR